MKKKLFKLGILIFLFLTQLLNPAKAQDLNQQFLKAIKSSSIEQIKKFVEQGADVNTQEKSNGKTALYIACENKDYKITKYLLQNKANPNIHDKFGITPLYSVVKEYSDSKYALLLLENGANPDITDKNGGTCLHRLAGFYRNEQIREFAQLFIYYKANTNIKNNDGDLAIKIAKENKKEELVKILKNKQTDIYFLAKFGKIDEIKSYIEKYKVEINKPDKTGQTILSHALESINDRLEVIEYLLNKGADMNFITWDLLDVTIINDNYEMLERALQNDKKKTLYTPLQIAIQQSSFKTVKVLIEHGLKTDKTKKWDDGLMLEACRANRLDVVKYLISKNIDVDSKNYINRTALHFACIGENYNKKKISPELIKILVDAGANINAQDEKGNTPLLYAIKNNASIENINYLIDKAANVKLANEINETVLHNDYLYKKNNFPLLKKVVDKGIDVKTKTKNSETALLYAIDNNNLEAIKYLLEKGAEKLQNKHIEHAIKTKNIELVKLLTSKGDNINFKQLNTNIAVESGTYEILEFLLSKGADANYGGEWKNPLHYAAKIKNSTKTIDLLLQKGAKINAKSGNACNNFTPVDYAVEEQNIENVKFLVSKGANIHTNNTLTSAVKNQNYDLTDFLIKSGYNVNKIDNNNQTALFYASGCCININILKLLLKNGAKVKICNKNGEIPLHFAVERGNKQAINLLKEYYQREMVSTPKNNALMQKDLIIEERIPLDLLHYSVATDNFQQKLLKSLHFECENFNNIDFLALLKQKLLDKTISNYYDFKPYSYMPSKMLSKDEITENMGGGIDEIYVEDIETGEMKLVEIEIEINKAELNGIMSNDKWYFDEKNFKLTKEVKAYCPIRKYYTENDGDEDDVRYRKIGYFVFNDFKDEKAKLESESRMKLFKKLKYEFYLENINYEKLKSTNDEFYYIHFEKNNSPFWTSYAINKFRDIILDRVLTAQSEAYDFNTGKKLSIKQVLKNLGQTTKTIWIDDFTPDEIFEKKIKIFFDKREIKSVIFIENWYIDQQTMRLKKEIVGVAPVRWIQHDDAEESRQLVKEIPFVVYFDKQKPNNYDVKYITETIPLDSVALKPKRDMFNNHAYYQFENTDINFKKLFVKNIYKNKVKFYQTDYKDDAFIDYKKENYKQIDTTMVLKRIGIKSDTIYVDNLDGGLEKKAIRTKAYGTDSISVIRSKEIWKFDAKNFKFYKKVFAYSPAIKFYREKGGNAQYRLIATILNNESLNEFSEKVPRKMKLFKKIKYEFGYDSEKMLKTDIPESEKEESLFWNSYNKKKFKEIIFDRITNKKHDVYSFDKMQKLSLAEVDSLMVLGVVEDIDPETGEMNYIKKKYQIEDLKTFIFYENWYINPKTLQIHKKVLGVAPVFYISSDKIEKKIPFFIYLN